MEKRVYNLTKQERDYFCVPAVFQAIMRRRGQELSQADIAAEINFNPEKLPQLKNTADFFCRRGLELTVYSPFDMPLQYYRDHDIFFADVLEADNDLIVGYEWKPKLLHAFLALDFQSRQLTLIEPGECLPFSIDACELERKMNENSYSVYGIVKRL